MEPYSRPELLIESLKRIGFDKAQDIVPSNFDQLYGIRSASLLLDALNAFIEGNVPTTEEFEL